MIQITAIRLQGSSDHEHIVSVKWRNLQTGVTGESTRQAVVSWLDESNANQAVVANAASWVYVRVVRPEGRPAYLRTHADGKWSDNLLALPPV
ncbi:MAG TPA: DUF3892 domain-containing protein [Solirubrobacteraceae bacterium]|nr:DUF3892 domain-containing protein [Solirubrobacteraceae bacterium]